MFIMLLFTFGFTRDRKSTLSRSSMNKSLLKLEKSHSVVFLLSINLEFR